MDKEESLKDRLVKAGEKILAEQGFEALTLRATARLSGVSHMAPYRHFKDKDALLAAIAQKGFYALTKAMGEARDREAGSKKQLRAIGMAYVLFALDQPALYRLMFGGAIKDKFRFASLVKAGDEAYDLCHQAITSTDLKFSKAEVQARSIVLWSLVHGLASLLIDEKIPTAESDANEVKDMIASVLDSLLCFGKNS